MLQLNKKWLRNLRTKTTQTRPRKPPGTTQTRPWKPPWAQNIKSVFLGHKNVKKNAANETIIVSTIGRHVLLSCSCIVVSFLNASEPICRSWSIQVEGSLNHENH